MALWRTPPCSLFLTQFILYSVTKATFSEHWLKTLRDFVPAPEQGYVSCFPVPGCPTRETPAQGRHLLLPVFTCQRYSRHLLSSRSVWLLPSVFPSGLQLREDTG